MMKSPDYWQTRESQFGGIESKTVRDIQADALRWAAMAFQINELQTAAEMVERGDEEIYGVQADISWLR